MAGEASDIRIRSSRLIGLGPSRSMMRPRSLGGRVEIQRLATGLACAEHDRPFHDRRDGVDDVAGFRGQRRALLDQVVGAGGARIERRTRHRKNLAALFGGHPRGDQRARPMRGLHHDDAECRARDQSIAAREIPRARHVTDRHFGYRAALLEQRGQQILVLGRIDPVMAAGQHRDGAALDGGAMRGLIDAARQPRDDDKAGVAEIARQRGRQISARRRTHCASRRSQSSAASAPQARRARQARAGHRRASPAAADSRLHRARAGRRRSCWLQPVRPARRPRCRCVRAAKRHHAAPDRAGAPALTRRR